MRCLSVVSCQCRVSDAKSARHHCAAGNCRYCVGVADCMRWRVARSEYKKTKTKTKTKTKQNKTKQKIDGLRNCVCARLLSQNDNCRCGGEWRHWWTAVFIQRILVWLSKHSRRWSVGVVNRCRCARQQFVHGDGVAQSVARCGGAERRHSDAVDDTNFLQQRRQRRY